MEQILFRNLDMLEKIERRLNKECKMLGTVVGIVLILIVLAITFLSVYVAFTWGLHAIDWILRNFFGFRLF